MDYRCSSTVLRRLFGHYAAGQRSSWAFLHVPRIILRQPGDLFVLLTMGTNGKNFAENPTLTIYLLVAIFAFSIVIGESLIYLGLNRLGRFEKSPVLMHALLTTAWVLVALIVYNIAFQMMPNPLASSL